MLTRRVELRSPVPPDHQVTPYPTHLPAPHLIHNVFVFLCIVQFQHKSAQNVVKA
jgi:hypothetical protein